MEIIVKKLTECTITEISAAWNNGFEGYFVKIDMTPEVFFTRLINEGLSMEHSIVAFDQERPVGIVLNGFRTVNGLKTAWNGGTGVASGYRGKGVSRLLMEETSIIYKEQGTEAASLEAIKENVKAIGLYEKYGYKIIDSLFFLSGSMKLEKENRIQATAVRPELLAAAPFYEEDVPWQCMWQSVKNGEAQIYYDGEQHLLGYSLFRRSWNQEGNLEKVFIYQLELLPGANKEWIRPMLAMIAGNGGQEVSIIMVNTSAKKPVTEYLLANGFQITTEQVRMAKK